MGNITELNEVIDEGVNVVCDRTDVLQKNLNRNFKKLNRKLDQKEK